VTSQRFCNLYAKCSCPTGSAIDKDPVARSGGYVWRDGLQGGQAGYAEGSGDSGLNARGEDGASAGRCDEILRE